MEIQLRQQVLYMAAHRSHADVQLLGDHAVVEAGPDQRQDLQLPFGQPLYHVRALPLPHELRPLVPDYPPQRVRRQQEFPGGSAVERGHERSEPVQLEVHQSERACRHEVVQALIVSVGRQDHHAGIGIPGHDLLDHLGPGVTGVPAARENHVRMSVMQKALGFREIPPKAHYLDTRHCRQRTLQGLFHDKRFTHD